MSFALLVEMPMSTFQRLVPGATQSPYLAKCGLERVLRARRTSLTQDIDTDKITFSAVWDSEPDQHTMHDWYRFFPSEEPSIKMGVVSRT